MPWSKSLLLNYDVYLKFNFNAELLSGKYPETFIIHIKLSLEPIDPNFQSNCLSALKDIKSPLIFFAESWGIRHLTRDIFFNWISGIVEISSG